jgi:hypothetical protein
VPESLAPTEITDIESESSAVVTKAPGLFHLRGCNAHRRAGERDVLSLFLLTCTNFLADIGHPE